MSRPTRSHTQAFGDCLPSVPKDDLEAMPPVPDTATSPFLVHRTPAVRQTYGKRRFILRHEESNALNLMLMGSPAKRAREY